MSELTAQRVMQISPVNLLDYIIPLEQAKALAGQGILSPSLFIWVESTPGSFEPVPTETVASSPDGNTPAHYNAYSLQEMLNLLPATVNVPLKSSNRSKFDHMLFYGLLPGKGKHFVK